MPNSPTRTRVFWDVVDLPFPSGLSPKKINHNMKQVVQRFGYGDGDLSIMAYVDSESSLVLDKSAYKDADITIIESRERDRFMLLDIALWELGMRNETPNLLVISKKIKKGSVFLTFLEEMYDFCNVIGVATPHDPSSSIRDLVLVDFKSLYTSLLLGRVQPFDQSESDHPKRIKLEEPLNYFPPLDTSSISIFEPPPFTFLDNLFVDNPRFYSPHAIRYSIGRIMSMFGFRGEFSVMAGVGLEEKWVDCFKEAGIIIIPPRAHIISVDIVLWAMENPATFFQPRTLVVLSDNVKEGTDLYNALDALRYRNYHVSVFKLSHPRRPPVFIWPSIDDIVSKEVSIAFSNKLPSLYNHNYNFHSWPIHVFLNVQGCSTRKSATLSSAILSGLRNKGYGGNVFFKPYLDMDSGPVPRGNRDGYTCLPSIKVEGDKSALVTRMLLDILFWAMNYDDQPLNVMLITQDKDTKCDFVMQALERRGFNVIFIPPSHRIDSFESVFKSPPDHKLKKPCPKLTDLIQSQMLDCLPFCMYWLVDDCPSNPKEFRYLFSSTLVEKGYPGCESVNAYVDKSNFSGDLIELYRNSGLRVRCIPEDDELEKITLMSLDMISLPHHGQFNILIISKPFKDALFDSVVKALKKRGCSVLFSTVDYMLTFGTSLWSPKSILDGSCRDAFYVKYLTTFSQRGVYKGIFDAFVKIIREEGPTELYRGLAPSLIGVVPYAATNYFAYDSLRKAYRSFSKQEKIGNIETLLIGSLAGALSSTATFPLEVARKHMQVGAVSGRVVYKNMLDALVSILEHEGILGWYKGLGPSCLKLVPAAGISFMCYEACKKILVENNNQEA